MKATLKRMAGQKVRRLRVFQGDGPREQKEDGDPQLDGPDHTEHGSGEAELFWAGRNFAMRHSARVAA